LGDEGADIVMRVVTVTSRGVGEVRAKVQR
jgi:hypothetical protein